MAVDSTGCASGAAPAAFGSMMGTYSGASGGMGTGRYGGSGSGMKVGSSSRRSSPQTPFEVLSDRYARGDIDPADYEQRRHALQSQR